MTLFVNMIELISLLGIGLMAGASLYISWVEVPARQDLATLDKLVNWQSIFPKAMAVLKTSGMVILPFILLIMVFRFHIGWLVAFVLLMALGPFTAKKLRQQMKYCSASHRRQTPARSNAKLPIGDVCITCAHG